MEGTLPYLSFVFTLTAFVLALSTYPMVISFDCMWFADHCADYGLYSVLSEHLSMLIIWRKLQVNIILKAVIAHAM